MRDSDVTLLLGPDERASPGCAATVAACRRLRRPLIVVDDVPPAKAGAEADANARAQVVAERTLRHLARHGGGLTVNVAGPRESEWPGAHESCVMLLAAILRVDGRRLGIIPTFSR